MIEFPATTAQHAVPDLLRQLDLSELMDDRVAALAQDIEKFGFAEIPGCVGPNLLANLRGLVRQLVVASGGEYVVLSGREEMAGTLLEAIGTSPGFLQLLRRLYEKTGEKPLPRQSLYQVLRCLAGKTGIPQAYFFHYDTYVVTALLPILTPIEGNTGDLVMRPNVRKVRSSYIANLFDKFMVDNKVAQKLFRRAAIARSRGFIKVKLVPGNLYLFWGYRSIHANEPCETDKIRATALFHFGDPHANSLLRKVSRLRLRGRKA